MAQERLLTDQKFFKLTSWSKKPFQVSKNQCQDDLTQLSIMSQTQENKSLYFARTGESIFELMKRRQDQEMLQMNKRHL